MFDHLSKWLLTRVNEEIGSWNAVLYLGTRMWRVGNAFIEKPALGYIDSMADTMEAHGVKIRNTANVSTPGLKRKLTDANSTLVDKIKQSVIRRRLARAAIGMSFL